VNVIAHIGSWIIIPERECEAHLAKHLDHRSTSTKLLTVPAFRPEIVTGDS
jgi:hypothetical protein